jgi:hypothetical protein
MADPKPPSQFTVLKYADVGTSEEFVRQMLELFDVLNATLIVDREREAVHEALGSIQMEGLLPAFLGLKKIRQSAGEEMPVLDRLQLYEDFARKLWKSYKDLTQRTADAMGFKIGFLFQKDVQFEVGLKKFRGSNPSLAPGFEDFLRHTRCTWQKDLASFRNEFLEHQSQDRTPYKKFYAPSTAENLFDVVWRTIVEILAQLLSLRLPPGVTLVDQGSNEPGRQNPNRFAYHLQGFKEP